MRSRGRPGEACPPPGLSCCDVPPPAVQAAPEPTTAPALLGEPALRHIHMGPISALPPHPATAKKPSAEKAGKRPLSSLTCLSNSDLTYRACFLIVLFPQSHERLQGSCARPKTRLVLVNALRHSASGPSGGPGRQSPNAKSRFRGQTDLATSLLLPWMTSGSRSFLPFVLRTTLFPRKSDHGFRIFGC